MAEQMSLDTILSEKDAPPKTEAPATPTTPAEPAATTESLEPKPVSSTRRAHQVREREARDGGRPRDPETGKFEAKTDAKTPEKAEAKTEPEAKPKAEEATDTTAKTEPATPPKQDLTPRERAFLRAAQQERQKRQDQDQEIARLRAISAAAQQQQQQNQQVTFQENPEAYFNALAQQQAGAVIKSRVETSEMLARKTYADYEEKCNKFKELCETVPGLFEQALAQPDPAEFVYKTAKHHQEIADAGNLDAFKAKIEKETRIKAEAEFKAKAEADAQARQRERDALPGSLSNVTGVGGANARPVWGGPTPLDSILKS